MGQQQVYGVRPQISHDLIEMWGRFEGLSGLLLFLCCSYYELIVCGAVELRDPSSERLGLLSLEHGRLRGDLVEVCKIMRGIDKVNGKGFFPRV
eukprot:g31551.t1